MSQDPPVSEKVAVHHLPTMDGDGFGGPTWGPGVGNIINGIPQLTPNGVPLRSNDTIRAKPTSIGPASNLANFAEFDIVDEVGDEESVELDSIILSNDEDVFEGSAEPLWSPNITGQTTRDLETPDLPAPKPSRAGSVKSSIKQVYKTVRKRLRSWKARMSSSSSDSDGESRPCRILKKPPSRLVDNTNTNTYKSPLIRRGVNKSGTSRKNTTNIQALYELELAGCNEITEQGLWQCLHPRIVSLTLTDCINVADEAVGAVAQLLPALYEFQLQAYHVTDQALGYFSPKQGSSLGVLRLHSCWEVTNHGVVNIVHSLPNLTVLSLSGCSKITDDGVELIAENLQKLRSLDLSWCPRITDAALEYIACDLNQLEELTLDRCVHVTDIGIGYISTMLSLQSLYLRWCSQIRDFGLQHLCGMRNLQILSLAGCPLLTSNGLSSLIQLRHMRELELTNCPGASRELFDYLKEHLPRCLVIE